MAVIGLLVAVLLFAGHRVQLLRRGGTQIVARALPAGRGKGWRHGVMRYQEEDLVLFRVSSLRPGPDRRLQRCGIEVLGRRDADASEGDVVPTGTVVLHVTDGEQETELALTGGQLTAFLSWVESSPPGRARRVRRH
ncbi:DUF2550 domain-containing protein [Rhodococcus sp. X156]|uniref:DUF2550 domain-containing protein n=1 Tax=Rhodococcus sp. X156 TaxID=2499145 RepID=UPI000FD96702|nr:DUF2550 domain-containing protein [Rhodococcus sp. X156]